MVRSCDSHFTRNVPKRRYYNAYACLNRGYGRLGPWISQKATRLGGAHFMPGIADAGKLLHNANCAVKP